MPVPVWLDRVTHALAAAGYHVLAALGGVLGLLVFPGVMLFTMTLRLTGRSLLLIPVVILLLPLTIALGSVSIVAWSLSTVIAFWVWSRTGVEGTPTLDGLSLVGRQRRPTVVRWADVDRIDWVQKPPISYYRVSLRSGDDVAVVLMREEHRLATFLAAAHIPFTGRGPRG